MSSTVCTASRCMAEDAHMTLKRTHSFLTCVCACVCARACIGREKPLQKTVTPLHRMGFNLCI